MRYECKECCDELMPFPCVIIIPDDVISNKWICVVTPNKKRANFISIIAL